MKMSKEFFFLEKILSLPAETIYAELGISRRTYYYWKSDRHLAREKRDELRRVTRQYIQISPERTELEKDYKELMITLANKHLKLYRDYDR